MKCILYIIIIRVVTKYNNITMSLTHSYITSHRIIPRSPSRLVVDGVVVLELH